MAANGYYQHTQDRNNYFDPESGYSNTNFYSSDNHAAESPYTTYTPSIAAPSYKSNDPVESGSNRRPPVSPPKLDHSKYSEQIPMKSTSKINTRQNDWRDQSIHYPISPESQIQEPILPQNGGSQKRRKKHNWFREFFSVTHILTLIQITVFIYEIVRNSTVTGSPIMIHPQFNPMIGPSTYMLINMGARFVPCMRTTPGIQDSTVTQFWPCPNATTTDSNSSMNKCSLSDLCGFGGLNFEKPDQWYRFITPIFLHAGLIHIGFNMLLQMTMGREVEKIIGPLRYTLVYFSSGIFGFVLGGNFAATAIASTGASGCLFGILAIVLLQLLYTWRERPAPGRELMWIIFEILISFVLGLLPGLDNFSHIGGFLMGLGSGICILHSPNFLRQRIGEESTTYRDVGSSHEIRSLSPPRDRTDDGNSNNNRSQKNPATTAIVTPVQASDFTKQPVGFFKGRKPLWWVWWLIRVGCLIGVLIGFVVLLTNFYNYRSQCSWCKYLSCLPINNWCDIGNLQLENSTTTSSNVKRALLGEMSLLNVWDHL